jgi:hypothetical protein
MHGLRLGIGLGRREETGTGDLAGTGLQNIPLFVESSVVREVSMHHGLLLTDLNDESDFRLVCSNLLRRLPIFRAGFEARPDAPRISGGAACRCDWQFLRSADDLGDFSTNVRGDLWQKT